jgi:phospholipid/cholesterol/gamma-HCH transport system permease protein
MIFGQSWRWGQRFGSTLLLWGQVLVHLLRGRVHRRNWVTQLEIVGPESLLVVVLTGLFVGMVFTIQVVREFVRFGSGDLVGGGIGAGVGAGIGTGVDGGHYCWTGGSGLCG